MSAETYRDAWGIPHLRAGSVGELARAQGRVTARDRAWQLEVERHRAQGTSASFLGPEALSWDRFARRARLADTARRCFTALAENDPETAAWVRSYVDGVNEGLAEKEPSPEFARTGLAPGRWEPWTPLGVWLATHILFAGFPAKLWREHITAHLGPEAVALFATDGPGTAGSNGWLVSGERTVTGHAVIAGDPHRWIEDPGVYQQIHLSCPEFDVVGLAVPGVPGIAHFGHTGTVAWAITNAMADYQDLYRERLRRTGAGVEALGPDGAWHRAARHTETIDVAGEGTAEVEVIETDRGPVIAGGPEGLDDGTPAALSLRYPPRVTGDLGFGALLPLLRARRVADVDRALDAWAEPVNVVQAADTEGGLLHRVAGRVPVRAESNRLRPVSAWEPGHAWDGWHTPPRAGLADGVAVMANQRGPAAPLGVEFAPPHRADRIAALLAGKEHWSAADMPAIHTDTHLGSAGPLLHHLATLEDLSPEAAALRGRLLAWDRRMDAGSTDAAVYAAVRGAVVRRLAAHPSLAPAAVPPAYPEVLQPWLALLPRVGHALEHLLRAEDLYGIDRAAAVRDALEEVAARPPAGTWGDTHRLAPWRALPATPRTGEPGPSGEPGPAEDAGLSEEAVPSQDAGLSEDVGLPEDAGPAEEPGLSGDHDCVLCTSAVPGLTDRAARGPAARYVWDLADRQDSSWVVPHGACGVPGSPHHRDQQPLWLEGGLAPVITDFDRLTKETDV
ncbi:penicillin amidase [Streptomyces ambofaciens]|uniref:Penicillin amidase n=1 Tax=Streptomyces ambofaciens TaxID=1889 RepID=A0ABN4P8B0_STRAM|nr:penicillin acylase family protein [Streptomyces ambofaciens]ANB07249.1 penicillin amidase [Streptomyces ambofaciens]